MKENGNLGIFGSSSVQRHVTILATYEKNFIICSRLETNISNWPSFLRFVYQTVQSHSDHSVPLTKIFEAKTQCGKFQVICIDVIQQTTSADMLLRERKKKHTTGRFISSGILMG